MAGNVGRPSAAETSDAILGLIRSIGSVSRTELATSTGLTGATITRVVRQLLDAGLIVEGGQAARSAPGKPRTLLRINGRARSAVGVSLDYLRTSYVLVDLDGTLIARQVSKGAGSRRPAEVTAQLVEEAHRLVGQAGMGGNALRGIGVAVAGHLNVRELAYRLNPRTHYWRQYDLESALRSMTSARVLVENDSTCAAVGDFWLGRYPESTNFATVYMATGFGLGLMIDGKPYRGSSALAGEISHMVVDPSGRECACGRRGCLHTIAAAESLVEHALANPDLVSRLGLKGSPRSLRADFNRLANAVPTDPDAAALIRTSAEALASVMVSVTNLLDLERVTLAGPGFAAAGDVYADVLRHEFENRALSRGRHPIHVELSTHGDDVAALGAASLVLSSGVARSSVGHRGGGRSGG
ncbi:ROK family transcriptional regulator [Kribbella solani]|uniref:Putative NBD/HSP70 family sugar kinase n=1 Tax=Kribbella solani TaxID=236067 RepID=A0A841DMC7_9ACTN|nr:ROK family transcriptional regulator [Kribbella solani]MBB5977926.1 putative NBD/HSP70 family sugar kinase [Kribbella solani]